MKKIYSNVEKKFVEVRNLKNLVFKRHPKYKFFLHRALGATGYTVSEESSGAAVAGAYDTRIKAINEADYRLNKVTSVELKRLVEEAISKAAVGGTT